jgi:hypothetical protein
MLSESEIIYILQELKAGLQEYLAEFDFKYELAITFGPLVGSSGWEGKFKATEFLKNVERVMNEPTANNASALVHAAAFVDWGIHTKSIIIPCILQLAGFNLHPDEQEVFWDYYTDRGPFRVNDPHCVIKLMRSYRDLKYSNLENFI